MRLRIEPVEVPESVCVSKSAGEKRDKGYGENEGKEVGCITGIGVGNWENRRDVPMALLRLSYSSGLT
jgi:hypothetical protein